MTRAQLNKPHVQAYLDRLREKVRAMLGNSCKRCGATARLEVDHIHGRTWNLRKVNRWVRWKRYLEEAERGEVQLLCKTCNLSKGSTGNGA